MKKTVLVFSGLLLSAFMLAACSKGTSQSSTNNTSSVNKNQAGASLSQVNMLLVGTLKLENTTNAVTKDQATQLLPLWQAYRSLSTSQTAAEAEVEGLLKQIQSSMTSSQVQEIEAMKLSNTDMMNLLQTLGPAMGPQVTPNAQGTPSGGFFTNGGMPTSDGNSPSGRITGGVGDPPSSSSGGTSRNMPQGGMVFQGGPGGDAGSSAGIGGGPTMQGTPDPSMQATAQARFSTQASRVNTILLDVLINKLTVKASG